jgi:hypothetical protein
MGILKRARVVLACAALAAPFTAAAVATPALALAAPAVSAHQAASPDTTGCVGGKAAETQPLGSGENGTVLLCYDSVTRTVWAKVFTSNLSPCFDASHPGPGCGTASVTNSRGASKSCDIASGATVCATERVDDAGITSVAAAVVIVACHTGGCTTVSGSTDPY